MKRSTASFVGLAGCLLAFAAGCASDLSVVGGPAPMDAAADATGTDDLARVADDGPAPNDAPGLDVAIDAGPVDVPVDAVPDAPVWCTDNAGCVGNPGGGACDVARGVCVPCVPSADTCPVGRFCSGSTCVPGCRNDEACAPAGDAGTDGGGLPATGHCNVATRSCVACVTDEHCPSGMLCVGNVCVSGCTASRPCPGATACCSGACVDVVSNVANCGACDRRCAAPNATSACQNAMCAIGACISPFADCDRVPSNGCEVDTLSDTLHCGACGTPCATRPHAASACAGGRCEYACDAGWADCDGVADNGCEVDLRHDVSHCGACTTACNPPNGAPACLDAMCAVAACAGGYGDCDGNPTNGCETDLSTTVAHCGACATACAARPNAFPGCLGGTCATSCVMGFQDCDGVASNGCEVDVRSAVTDCGACGRPCSPSNATGACAGGRCAVASCDPGFADCNGVAADGCEVNLQGDVNHCGTCATACTAAGGTPGCTAGVCGVSSCAAGRGDCDRSASNGCEVDLTTSVTSCGSCGALCDLPNATAACTGGRCAVATCAAGFADCDGVASNGCEVNVRTDATNCGACRSACAPANAAGACVGGACTVAACQAGFGDCDGAASNGCEANLAADVSHCGGCATACSLPNASAACSAGRCVIAACAGAFGNCDGSTPNGCEVDLSSTPSSCGACGARCALPNTASAGCAGGGCTVLACVGGYGNCDGAASNGCEANLSADPNNCGGCGARPPELCNLADDNCNGVCDDGSGCRVAVYRYHNGSTGEHFYTASLGEVGGGAWALEGPAPYYYLYAGATGPLLAFDRCYMDYGKHFYTTSQSPPCEGASPGHVEGVLGFIAPSPVCGAVPLYRLWNPSGDHLYTIDAGERGAAIGAGYYDEGVAGYVWTAPGG